MSDYLTSEDIDQQPGDNTESYLAEHAVRLAQADDLLIQVQALLEQERYSDASVLLGDWQPHGLSQQFWMRYRYVKGTTLLNLDELVAAADQLTRALQIAEQLNDRAYVGLISYRLGVYNYRINKFPLAETYFLTSWWAIKDGAINHNIKFSMYVNLSLGNAVMRQGRFKGAIAHYSDALKDAEYLRNSRWVATIYWGMGLCYKYLGENALAKVNIAKSLEIQQTVAVNSFLAEITGMYGMILMELNQTQAAERELHHAIYLGKQVGNKGAYLVAYANLAEAYLYQERFDEALSIAQQSVAEAREAQAAPLNLAQVLHTLGRVYTRRHELVQAIEAFTEAETLLHDSNDEFKYANLLRDYGIALVQHGDHQIALPKLEQAIYIVNPELKNYAITYLYLEGCDLWGPFRAAPLQI